MNLGSSRSAGVYTLTIDQLMELKIIVSQAGRATATRKPWSAEPVRPSNEATNYRGSEERDNDMGRSGEAMGLSVGDMREIPDDLDDIDDDDDSNDSSEKEEVEADHGAEHVEARTPVASPTPLLPSRAQVDAHNITHVPFRRWCPHCQRGKARRRAHRLNRRKQQARREGEWGRSRRSKAPSGEHGLHVHGGRLFQDADGAV